MGSCNFWKEKKSVGLTDLEVSRLGAIVKVLKDTSHYHTSRFADADIVLLLNMLKSWPTAMIFPGKSINLHQLINDNF